MLISRGSVYAVPLLLAGVTSGLVPAASRAHNGADVAVAAALPAGQLDGVAAASARSAWAVGFTEAGHTLIVRWNGAAWKRVPSPSPGSSSSLSGVAVSGRIAWAVGESNGKTLILRWAAAAWKRVASPNVGFDSFLTGVAAVSAGSAWAVGSTGTGKTLILRWNGARWK